jgi:hypothetical protein
MLQSLLFPVRVSRRSVSHLSIRSAWELHCRDIFALMHWRLQNPEAALPAPAHLLTPLPSPYPPSAAPPLPKQPSTAAAVPEHPEWPLLKGRPPFRMLVLVGMPGSGKSTLAKRLLEHGWSRINQVCLCLGLFVSLLSLSLL